MANIIECDLCPRHCRLKEGQRGNCRVRIHLDGMLKTLVYGNPCAVHVDPIEKKPLYHVLPESKSFSIATAGCNLHCKYCQNWQISQRPPEETYNINLPPQQVIVQAKKYQCRSIAYTYSDPIIFYEYTFDTAILAHKQNLLNCMITAGYIENKPLLELCPVIDAANVDLKGITEEFYQNMSSAHLAPVLETLKTMKKNGVWVEITNLVIPSWNDNSEDIHNLCQWIIDHLGPDTPLHFSRFWPLHLLKNLPPTPVSTLTRAWEIAKNLGLYYVYIGNVPAHEGNNTYCPHDQALLIERVGYKILTNNIRQGKCRFCGTQIPGIWS